MITKGHQSLLTFIFIITLVFVCVVQKLACESKKAEATDSSVATASTGNIDYLGDHTILIITVLLI